MREESTPAALPHGAGPRRLRSEPPEEGVKPPEEGVAHVCGPHCDHDHGWGGIIKAHIEADLAKSDTLARAFHFAPAMRESAELHGAAYEALVDKIFSEILRFVAKEIVPGFRFAKSDDDDSRGRYGFVADVNFPPDDAIQGDPADSPFSPRRLLLERQLALLTPKQLEEIKDIVSRYHEAFALGTLGPDAIPPGVTQRLMDMGVVPQDLGLIYQPAPHDNPPAAMRITDLAYQYGTMAARSPAVRAMQLPEFRAHLEKTRPQLTTAEREAMAFARYNAGEHIRAIGDRFAAEVGQIVRNHDAELRQEYIGTVQRELENNIDRREEWRKLASRIGHATGDWGRDMRRVAMTEKQFAVQAGKAAAIAGPRGDGSKRVAKIPNPGACPDCIKHYLTAGVGSPPRIFRLDELLANGTNAGRKRADWLPTVGPLHPYCGCDLVEVPDGFVFDEDGDLVHESTVSPNLTKAAMSFGDAVPESELVIRVADPLRRQVIERVVAEADPRIFRKEVGVTLITTDIPREGNALAPGDFAYWTSNEIRISQTLPIERIPRVVRHELGHSLNVFLMRKWGGSEPVLKWHRALYAVSQDEGFVSRYARKLPIENAAEVTRMYLFERDRFRRNYPRQYVVAHAAYAEIFR